MFDATLNTSDGRQLGEIYSGYVPEWMPGEHYGDFVELDIDPFTGQILNWQKPTKAQMKETFKFGKHEILS